MQITLPTYYKATFKEEELWVNIINITVRRICIIKSTIRMTMKALGIFSGNG